MRPHHANPDAATAPGEAVVTTTQSLTIADLKRAAAQVGGTVDEHPGPGFARYNVDAPAGKVWATTGDIHAICLSWETRDDGCPIWPQDKQGAIADAIDRIAEGVAACDDPECDTCYPGA